MQNSGTSPVSFEIRSTPSSGRAVFATRNIPAHSIICSFSDLTVSALFRNYRREVCGQCFSYAQGRDLPVRDLSVGFAFCCEVCREKWRDDDGEVGVQAWTAVEMLVRKRGKEDNDLVDIDLPRPKEAEISLAWEEVRLQAELIRVARQAEQADGNSADVGVQMTKQHRKAVQKALQQPISPDVMSFCVSGILWMYNKPSQSQEFLYLEADPTPYPNADNLSAFTRSYLHLLAVLPLPLLHLLTPENLFILSSHDSHNAFGIRSLEDDGAEFFGYGCWPKASYFNHSCAPSVTKTRAGREWVFKANRDVDEGEELCITYLSGEERVLAREKRRRILKKNWGFECACVRCR